MKQLENFLWSILLSIASVAFLGLAIYQYLNEGMSFVLATKVISGLLFALTVLLVFKKLFQINQLTLVYRFLIYFGVILQLVSLLQDVHLLFWLVGIILMVWSVFKNIDDNEENA